jgi:hypothetical protein
MALRRYCTLTPPVANIKSRESFVIAPVNRPQEVIEDMPCHARPLPPRRLVREPEVNALVDANVDYVVGHV